MSDVKLSSSVTYRDSEGREKAALVIGTVASTHPEGGAAAPDAGNVHLSVFSPTGNRYTRHNVPEGDGPNTFTR